MTNEELRHQLGDDEYLRLCGEWRTPELLKAVICAEFGIGMDAAASPTNTLHPYRYFTREDDALSRSWDFVPIRETSGEAIGSSVSWDLYTQRNVWVQPPHADFYPWTAKSLEQVRLGIVDQVVVLTLPSFSADWWTDHASRADEIRLLTPRVPFDPPQEFIDLGYVASSNDRERCLVIFRRERRNPVAPLIHTWDWTKALDVPLTKEERADG